MVFFVILLLFFFFTFKYLLDEQRIVLEEIVLQIVMELALGRPTKYTFVVMYILECNIIKYHYWNGNICAFVTDAICVHVVFYCCNKTPQLRKFIEWRISLGL